MPTDDQLIIAYIYILIAYAITVNIWAILSWGAN